jgi:DNA repair exonuclease SbcCD nuclease subunit
MRLVHAADLHLDSPLRGLARLGQKDLADELRGASRRACENLVELVVSVGADAVVLAGDVYDGDWRDYQTGAFFARQMSRLRDERIPVFVIAGNHDAASEISRSLRLPDNVTVLRTDTPQTVIDEGRGLAVHGQGFATRAVTDNLVLRYPDRLSDLVNVGMLHSSVEGDPGHDVYAPCSPADLEACRYEYFALGHIHTRRSVCDGNYVAAFSGNLQGRHPRETGAKGALVVDVEPGSRASVEFRALDVARWEKVRVDVSACSDLDDVLAAVSDRLAATAAGADGRVLVAQVTLLGTSGAATALLDVERLRAEIDLEAEKVGVVIEQVRNRVQTPTDGVAVDQVLVAAVTAAMRQEVVENVITREVASVLDREFGRRLRTTGVDLASDAQLADLVQQAQQELLGRLSRLS